jgi:hypothetical protein
MTSPCLQSTGRPPTKAQCKANRQDRGSRIEDLERIAIVSTEKRRDLRYGTGSVSEREH